MPFKFSNLNIEGLLCIEPKVFPDERGYFLEFYKSSDFLKTGIKQYFVQDNFSSSKRGVLRGLHYQLSPHTQGKLVQCIRGEIFDVAVDLRKGSPTFGKWESIILSEQNYKMIYIPPGFAHGFCALEDKSLVLYKTTKEYAPNADKGILWSDPDINIQWPIAVEELIISDKDKLHSPLAKSQISEGI